MYNIYIFIIATPKISFKKKFFVHQTCKPLKIYLQNGIISLLLKILRVLHVDWRNFVFIDYLHLQGYLSFWSTHSYDIKSEGRYDDWAPFNVIIIFISQSLYEINLLL